MSNSTPVTSFSRSNIEFIAVINFNNDTVQDFAFLNPYCVCGIMFFCSRKCRSLKLRIFSEILRINDGREIGLNLRLDPFRSCIIRKSCQSFGNLSSSKKWLRT